MNGTRLLKHPRSRTRATLAVGLAAGLVMALAPVASAGGGPTIRPVADGFGGPLGLAVDRQGSIYVGEAFAGQLTKVERDGDRHVLTSGQEVAGIAVSRGLTAAWVQSIVDGPPGPGGEPPPIVEATLEVRKADGRTRSVASLYDYEVDQNPDADVTYGFVDLDPACSAQLPPFLPESYTGIVDSHPYALVRIRTGWVVADAAANALLEVTYRGHITTLAVLPPVPQVVTAEMAAEFGLPDCVVGATYNGESVPTDIEVDRHGNYLVTTLPGAPEAPGAGALWRVDRHTGDAEMLADGFSGAVDLAVRRNGTVYVAELFANRITKVYPGGHVAPWVDVPSPGALEFQPNGWGPLYATINVFGPGEVVAIR